MQGSWLGIAVTAVVILVGAIIGFKQSKTKTQTRAVLWAFLTFPLLVALFCLVVIVYSQQWAMPIFAMACLVIPLSTYGLVLAWGARAAKRTASKMAASPVDASSTVAADAASAAAFVPVKTPSSARETSSKTTGALRPVQADSSLGSAPSKFEPLPNFQEDDAMVSSEEVEPLEVQELATPELESDVHSFVAEEPAPELPVMQEAEATFDEVIEPDEPTETFKHEEYDTVAAAERVVIKGLEPDADFEPALVAQDEDVQDFELVSESPAIETVAEPAIAEIAPMVPVDFEPEVTHAPEEDVQPAVIELVEAESVPETPEKAAPAPTSFEPESYFTKATSLRDKGLYVIAARLYAECAELAEDRPTYKKAVIEQIACYVKGNQLAEARQLAERVKEQSDDLTFPEKVKIDAVLKVTG